MPVGATPAKVCCPPGLVVTVDMSSNSFVVCMAGIETDWLTPVPELLAVESSSIDAPGVELWTAATSAMMLAGPVTMMVRCNVELNKVMGLEAQISVSRREPLVAFASRV